MTAQTSSGKRLKIFDYERYDLRDKVGQTVNCLIHAWFLENTTPTNDDSDEIVITGEVTDSVVGMDIWN